MRAKTSLWSMLLAVIALAGCAGSDDGTQKTIDEGMAPRNADGTIIDDRALCDFKGRKDVEGRATAGPGAIPPNVRRVYKVYGQGDDRRRVLICREVDTNLDG